MSKVIHPAYLSAGDVGAIVRWEDGDAVRQGRLNVVRHHGETDYLDTTFGTPPSCDIVTTIEIEGCEPLSIRADYDRATVTIIRKAGA